MGCGTGGLGQGPRMLGRVESGQTEELWDSQLGTLRTEPRLGWQQ